MLLTVNLHPYNSEYFGPTHTLHIQPSNMVGMCRLDPGVKAPPGFQNVILKRGIITVLST